MISARQWTRCHHGTDRLSLNLVVSAYLTNRIAVLEDSKSSLQYPPPSLPLLLFTSKRREPWRLFLPCTTHAIYTVYWYPVPGRSLSTAWHYCLSGICSRESACRQWWGLGVWGGEGGDTALGVGGWGEEGEGGSLLGQRSISTIPNSHSLPHRACPMAKVYQIKSHLRNRKSWIKIILADLWKSISCIYTSINMTSSCWLKKSHWILIHCNQLTPLTVPKSIFLRVVHVNVRALFRSWFFVLQYIMQDFWNINHHFDLSGWLLCTLKEAQFVYKLF